MKKAVIIISVFTLIAISCGQSVKKKHSKTINNETIAEKLNEKSISEKVSEETLNKEKINEKKIYVSVIPSLLFDLSRVIELKNNTIDALNRAEKSEDKIIMSFLNNYSKLTNEFNRLLFDNENYEMLNDAFWENDNLSKDFINEVEPYGFKINESEGMISTTP